MKTNRRPSIIVEAIGRRVLGLAVASAMTALLASCAQAPVTPTSSPAPSAVAPLSNATVAPSGAAVPAPSSAALAGPLSSQGSNVLPVQPGLPGALPPRPLTRDPKSVASTAAPTPDGASRYTCERGASGAATRVAIELPEGSARICSRFPAMGPCQYERNACRASGGRVIRFDGIEITKDVEVEYDRQVQRFRLNAG